MNADALTITPHAYGNTRTELEMAALDEAREFFGPDARLTIRPGYHVCTSKGPAGEKYVAEVTVEAGG